METSTVAAPAEIARRASELVPMLQQNAPLAEEARRLPDEVVDAIVDTGVLRMRVPSRYGGHEADLRALTAAITEIGRGDGSAAWTLAVWSICSWLVGLFPDEAQDEVYRTPDVRVCGLLAPGGAGSPADGGLTISGRWPFNTGALQSHWNSVVVVAPGPGGEPAPVMALVPTSDLQVIDDWHTVGLRATGSVSTAAEELFVPQHRLLPLGPVLHEQYASRRNAQTPIYRTPMLLTACTSTAGAALGMAKAAREAFFERLPGRKITYSSYASQQEAPITHLQVAEATMKIDEAEFHAYRAAGLLDAKGASGDAWTPEERARIRVDVGRTVQLAKEAVDVLRTASGASSAYHTVPIQRIDRDMQTMSLHAILHPDTNLELYGRTLCGMEPNTLYI